MSGLGFMPGRALRGLRREAFLAGDRPLAARGGAGYALGDSPPAFAGGLGTRPGMLSRLRPCRRSRLRRREQVA